MANVTKVQIVGDLTHPSSSTRKPKGFKRSQKEWEASIAEHMGKFFDKLTTQDLIKLAAICAGTYSIKRLMSWPVIWTLIPLPWELKGVQNGDIPQNWQQEYIPWVFSLFASYILVEHGLDIVKAFPKI